MQYVFGFLFALTTLAAPTKQQDPYHKGGSEFAGELHWGYRSQKEELLIPEKWGELNPLCQQGTVQSPIDIRLTKKQTSTLTDSAPPEVHYQPTQMEVFHNRHTVQTTDRSNSNYVVFRGKRYTLRNIHYHRKSEHLIDGEQFDAEIHIVHESDDGVLLVLGTLVDFEGTRSSYGGTLVHMLHNVKGSRDQYIPTPIQVDPSKLLPSKRTYATYSGSLTTPPCKEQVRWIVFLDVQKVGILDREKFSKKLIDVGFTNFRPHFDVQDKHELRFSEK